MSFLRAKQNLNLNLLFRSRASCNVSHNSQINLTLPEPNLKLLNGILQLRIIYPIQCQPLFQHQPGGGTIVVVNAGIGLGEGGIEDGRVEGEVVAGTVLEVSTGERDVMFEVVMAEERHGELKEED
jgi:hypothetical protein